MVTKAGFTSSGTTQGMGRWGGCPSLARMDLFGSTQLLSGQDMGRSVPSSFLPGVGK